ncbi:MAG: hypothetical protein AB7G88_12555, partial [Thermomicrobiales bacterium]
MLEDGAGVPHTSQKRASGAIGAPQFTQAVGWVLKNESSRSATFVLRPHIVRSLKETWSTGRRTTTRPQEFRNTATEKAKHRRS